MREGGEDLRACLSAISTQELEEEVEVLVVDSGSSDDSRQIAAAAGARVERIAPESFTHGGARNLGARLARGDVLVFASQDTVAADEHWLARLVAPLRADPRVAGVYGRQLPRDDAAPPERYFLDFLYGPSPRRQEVRAATELSMSTTLFSNANAAVRRSVWERFPFADDVIMSEDQDWSRRVLLAGHAVVYEPRAAVRHSHRYTLVSAFRRFFDSGVSAERAYLAGGVPARAVLRGTALRYARGELAWLWRTGRRRWIPYAALYESAKLAGLQLGARHRALPRGLRPKLSALPGYWEREARPPTPAKLLAAVGSGKRVVDVGCSSRYLARALSERGNTVVGIEQDERAAAEARRWCEQVLTGDVETMTLPLEPASFDVLLCADLLERLRNPCALLARLRPLLRPTGRLVLSTPNVANWAIRLSLLAGRWRYAERGSLGRTHVHPFTRRTLVECLERAGYSVERLDFTVPVPMIGIPAVEAAAHAVGRLRPSLLANQFIVTARPKMH